jgi:signal transduction histidine kinase
MSDIKTGNTLNDILFESLEDGMITFKFSLAGGDSSIMRINSTMASMLGVGSSKLIHCPDVSSILSYTYKESPLSDMLLECYSALNYLGFYRREWGILRLNKTHSACRITFRRIEDTDIAIGIFRNIEDEIKLGAIGEINKALGEMRAAATNMKSPEDWANVAVLIGSLVCPIVCARGAGVQIVDLKSESFVSFDAYGGFRQAGMLNKGIPRALMECMVGQKVIYRKSYREIDDWSDMVNLPGSKRTVGSVVDIPFSHGTIAFNHEEEGAFSDTDLDIMERFADAISDAYHKSLYFASVEKLETEIRERDESITDSHAAYKSLFDLPSQAVLIVRGDMSVVMANRASENLFGVLSSDMVSLSTLLDVEDNFVSTHIKSGRRFRWNMKRGGRQEFWVEITVNMAPRQLEPGAFAVSIVDIDAQVESERIDRQKTNLISLGYMAGSIAHELSRPIQSIGMNVGIARMMIQRGVEDDAMEVLSNIEKSVESSRRYIDELLSFSGGDSNAPKESIDVNDVVDAALRMSEMDTDYFPCKIHASICANCTTVNANVKQVKSLLLNLIHNSRDALRGVRYEPEIHISTREVSTGEIRYVAIEVMDNGPGIDPDKLKDIFDPLFSTKGKTGRGFGLAFSKNIANSHGGRLEIRNRDDRSGVIATLYIPPE